VGRLFGEGAERAQATALEVVFVVRPTASRGGVLHRGFLQGAAGWHQGVGRVDERELEGEQGWVSGS